MWGGGGWGVWGGGLGGGGGGGGGYENGMGEMGGMGGMSQMGMGQMGGMGGYGMGEPSCLCLNVLHPAQEPQTLQMNTSASFPLLCHSCIYGKTVFISAAMLYSSADWPVQHAV